MPVLRAIFAIVIALSVAVAPVTVAWAALRMGTEMQMVASAQMAADSDMADCHRTMKPAPAKDCSCCDTQPKAPCSETDCLLKCGTLMLGVLLVSDDSVPDTLAHSRPADPQKPPDWTSRPPAPPPRV